MSSLSIKGIFLKSAIMLSVFFGLQNTAQAQFTNTDSDKFLEAVDKRDGAEATKFIDQGLVNTKQRITGRTALHIVVERRDSRWLNFLLAKKARPDVKDRDGLSPLMRAVELNFVEGVESILSRNANVDYPNRSGETPLIKAVQLGRPNLVQILLDAGADPDRNDIIQGLSAREYAARDPRKSRLLAMIEAHEEKKKKEAEEKGQTGKGLDLSGFTGPTLD